MAYGSELLRQCRHAVTDAVSGASSAREAAVRATEALASALGWACAEYWEVDPDGVRISRVSSWTRAGTPLASFTGAEPMSFGRGQGIPGAVWQRGSDVWCTDLLRDLIDPGRLRHGHTLGLRTAVGTPVHDEDRVAGVLALFADGTADRDDDVLAMLHDTAGQIGRLLERRRVEELTRALAAARRDFDRVIEQVNDCFWSVEICPDGSVRSVYASPGGGGVFGGTLPTDTDMGSLLAERILPEDREQFQRFHETARSGQPAQFECRVLGYDQVVRWVWTRAAPRREDGRLFFDGITTNVTERRELADKREELLAQEQQQVRRLRELDRMKDELVAVVSHELRNPIAIIEAYTAELMEEPELGGREELAVIARTSAHLVHLVEDLLDLARFDNGRTAVDLRPLRLIRQAVEDHRRHAEARPVTLTVEMGALPMVPGDAARLRQVLDNLLSNAIKYTPPGGAVTASAYATGEAVVISVADTGIGIPAEQYAQLFTRFFRASTATSRKIKGTGLGLAVTKAIVEAHGGTITAEPGPAGGTRFNVALPRFGDSGPRGEMPG
ncbi:ATP-binding protein [Actinoplanes sp. NBRC 101535]|uniref:ATP-binding protein n=1 Tax=Actinoplanes sp. NBRC 101535 TaxID=3032196 RepID=UPI0024A49093|nr:ATP-binding protein [Actinoplanes sp. NBRC 101535]GLY02626.1 hypothetical protein Acsp01_30050 [Actinoplanes sp. NBRC 101535]